MISAASITLHVITVNAISHYYNNNNNNNNIAHFYRAPLSQSHRGASATAMAYNVTYTARDRITPKQCTYRQWGNAVRGMQTSMLLERHLANEFLFKFSVAMSVT